MASFQGINVNVQVASDSSIRNANNNMVSQGGFNSVHGMMNSTSGINSAGSGSGPNADKINHVDLVDSSSDATEQSKDEVFDFSGVDERPGTPSIMPSSKDLNH